MHRVNVDLFSTPVSLIFGDDLIPVHDPNRLDVVHDREFPVEPVLITQHLE